MGAHEWIDPPRSASDHVKLPTAIKLPLGNWIGTNITLWSPPGCATVSVGLKKPVHHRKLLTVAPKLPKIDQWQNQTLGGGWYNHSCSYICSGTSCTVSEILGSDPVQCISEGKLWSKNRAPPATWLLAANVKACALLSVAMYLRHFLRSNPLDCRNLGKRKEMMTNTTKQTIYGRESLHNYINNISRVNINSNTEYLPLTHIPLSTERRL